MPDTNHFITFDANTADPSITAEVTLHLPTGRMAVLTNHVAGTAWAVSFLTESFPGVISAYNTADGLTESEARALLAEWVEKV